MILGPSVQKPAATATTVVEDKTYEVTPGAHEDQGGNWSPAR